MSLLITVYIFAAFDVWLYTYFLQGLFERRFEDKWKNWSILATSMILLILLNSRQSASVNLFGGFSLLFFTARILYKGKTKNILFYELLFYVVVGLMEAITGTTIASLLQTEQQMGRNYSFLNSPLYIIISKMMTYLVILIIEVLLRKRSIGNHNYSLKKTFVLPVTTLVLMIGIQLSFQGNNTVVILGCVCLLFANIFMFYCIEEMVKAQEKNKEYELLRTQNEMKEIYYEKMEEISIEHRQYVHNLKDYLQTIGGLATHGKQSEIIELLKEMETQIESIREKRYTGNSILNALLCEKESIATKHGISIDIEPAEHMTFSYVKNHDLIVMVGNLLDNAIEAASLCETTKEIRLYFSQEQGNFETIQIDNTYNGVSKRDGERFLTTKEDQEKHGFGLKSVKESVQKYGGLLLTEPKEHIFTTILTLSKLYYQD